MIETAARTGAKRPLRQKSLDEALIALQVERLESQRFNEVSAGRSPLATAQSNPAIVTQKASRVLRGTFREAGIIDVKP